MNGRYRIHKELVVSKLDINQIENEWALLKHQLQKQIILGTMKIKIFWKFESDVVLN